jgi:integration host factor subunit alpha
MTVTKSILFEAVCHIANLKKPQAAAAVEGILEIIKSALAGGESVLIGGFGKFEVRDKNPRRGRNPQTGDDLMLDGRRVVTFINILYFNRLSFMASNQARRRDRFQRDYFNPSKYPIPLTGFWDRG